MALPATLSPVHICPSQDSDNLPTGLGTSGGAILLPTFLERGPPCPASAKAATLFLEPVAQLETMQLRGEANIPLTLSSRYLQFWVPGPGQ